MNTRIVIHDPAQRVVVRELRQGKSESESRLIDLARAAERRGDIHTARGLYEQPLSRNPKNYTAAQQLAELHRHKLKNTTDALHLDEQAANCDIDQPMVGRESTNTTLPRYDGTT